MDHQEREQELAAKLLLDYSSQIRDEFVPLPDRTDQDISSDYSTPTGSLESPSIPPSLSSRSSADEHQHHHHPHYYHHHNNYLHDTHVRFDTVPSNNYDTAWLSSTTTTTLTNDTKDIDVPVIRTAPCNSLKFVAVHLGVGIFRKVNHDEFKCLAKDVCSNIMSMSTQEYDEQGIPLNSELQLDAVEAVAQLVRQLEDNPLVNCGYGSNLNMRGTVECDASLMSGLTHRWVGVGSVSGCKNPILLAKQLYDLQAIPRPLHLVQPNLLVGQGAKHWMRENCPHLATSDSQLISSRAFKIYCKLKSSYDAAVKNYQVQANDTAPSTFKDSDMSGSLVNIFNDHHNGLESPDSAISPQPTTLVTNSCSAAFSKTKPQDTNGTSVVIHPAELDHGSYCRKMNDLRGNSMDHKQRLNISAQSNSGEAIYRTSMVPAHQLEQKSNGYNANTITITDTSAKSSSIENYTHDTHMSCDESPSLAETLYNRLDTVGAIAVDCNNNVACAISSGGIHLKANGRIGQAATPGAGCWAQNSVAVTTSGVGEFISTTLLARQLHTCLTKSQNSIFINGKINDIELVNRELKSCLNNEFLSSPALSHVDPAGRMSGFLALTLQGPDNLILSYGHNTTGMCVGFMSSADSEASSLISLRDDTRVIEESQSTSSPSEGEYCTKARGLDEETISMREQAHAQTQTPNRQSGPTFITNTKDNHVVLRYFTSQCDCLGQSDAYHQVY
ncbi:Threonine aspartase 1, partial [Fragariocoptes setiger]